MLKSIVSILGGIILIFLIFIGSLYSGIKINQITNDSFDIQSLYIKYDKKLIVSIEKLKIKPSKSSEPLVLDSSWTGYIQKALGYIKLVKIDDIVFEDKHFFAKFEDNILELKYQNIELFLKVNIKNDDIFYELTSNEIQDIRFIQKFVPLNKDIDKLIEEQLKFEYIKLNNLSGKIKLEEINNFDVNSLSVSAMIKKLNFKYEDKPVIYLEDIAISLKDGNIDLKVKKTSSDSFVTFDGDIQSLIDGKSVNINGKLFYKDIEINSKITIKDEMLDYQISTNKFSDIKVFEEFITIPQGIRKWAIVRLKAKNTKIDNVSGKIYLKDFLVDFTTLRVDAKLYDIVMDFNPKKAYPLEADIVHLDFDGKDMNIKLKNPKSNDVDLTGSDAVIYDMFGDSGLLLRLQSISPLNWTLVRVVQSYDVELPNQLELRQTKGKSDIKVIIDIPFSDLPTDVYVKILNQNSSLSIKGNKIDFKTFDFLYKDKKVFIKNTNAKYQQYNIDINDLLFDIKKSALNLNLDAYDQNVSANLKVDSNDLKVIDLNLKLENQPEDINKTINIFFSSKINLENNISIGDIKVNKFKIADVVDINDSNIPYWINFQDLNNLFVKVKLNIEDYKVFHKGKKLKDIDLKINVKDKSKVNIADGINMIDAKVVLGESPDIKFVLNEFGIEYYDDTNKTKEIKQEVKKDKISKKCENIVLNLPLVNGVMNNGYFKYNNNLIQYDKIFIDTNKTKVNFVLDKNITNILLMMNDDLNLSVKDLNKEFLNNVVGSHAIDGGTIDLNLYGTQCLNDTNITLKDVEIKSAKVLNKIFLVINSAPAIINPFLILPNAYRFASDGFKLKSYTIKDGIVKLNANRDTNVINIKKMDLKGVHSDFELDGNIDLTTNQINSKLDVIFMKDYAKIINFIPVVRYVLLGDEERFSYSINIDGNITNPNINTHFAKETLMIPINIIQRIITLPLLPFQDINMTDEQLENHQKIVEQFTN